MGATNSTTSRTNTVQSDRIDVKHAFADDSSVNEGVGKLKLYELKLRRGIFEHTEKNSIEIGRSSPVVSKPHFSTFHVFHI